MIMHRTPMYNIMLFFTLRMKVGQKVFSRSISAQSFIPPYVIEMTNEETCLLQCDTLLSVDTHRSMYRCFEETCYLSQQGR
jgi:hypothetical protein